MSLKKMIGNAFLKIGSALAIEKGEQDKIGEARQIFGTGMTSYLVEKIKDSINSPDVEVVSAIENGMTTIRAFHKDSPDRLWCKFGFYPGYESSLYDTILEVEHYASCCEDAAKSL